MRNGVLLDYLLAFSLTTICKVDWTDPASVDDPAL